MLIEKKSEKANILFCSMPCQPTQPLALVVAGVVEEAAVAAESGDWGYLGIIVCDLPFHQQPGPINCPPTLSVLEAFFLVTSSPISSLTPSTMQHGTVETMVQHTSQH